MSGKVPVLSISMLVSGQKEDMPKSLESLLFFKNAISCEIILVDTGCNAEQRALAEKYADRIVDFTWCNDFAAARNAGLKEARGEWFLYLDDDEWFDNPQEIILFFQSGEYKNYGSASYVVRNYSNAAGTIYDDSYPMRMIKRSPEVRFVGKIHEHLEPFKVPKKSFSDFAHHYGYVYQDEAEKKSHAMRNIEPLLDMRKEHPGDPRWMCQLVQEYFIIGDYEKAAENCRTGIEEWEALKDHMDYAPSLLGAVYGFLLISLDAMKRFEEEEKWLKKALANPVMQLDFMEPTMAFFCLTGARMYHQMGHAALSYDYFKRYLAYYKRLKDNRLLLEAGAAAIVAGVFQQNLLYGTVLICMGSLIRSGDYGLVEEAFALLDWTDRRLLHQGDREKEMLQAFCSVEYHPLWVKMLQTLVTREEGMEEMYVVFLETEIHYKQQGETEKLSRLRRLVSEIECEHLYILCAKILRTLEEQETSSEEQETSSEEQGSSEKERRQRAEELFIRLFERYREELPWVREEVWEVADRFKISMEPLLFGLDFLTWRRTLNQWSLEASPEELVRWEERLMTWKKREDIRYDYAVMRCGEAILWRHGESEQSENLRETERLLWKYADGVLAFYKPLYREEVFAELPEALPEEALLALRLKELQQFRERDDDKGALAQLRKCLGIYPVLEKVIDHYAQSWRDEMQRRNREAEEAQSELAGLVKNLKIMAKLQMERKEYQAAKEILLQIQRCLPEDEEVKRLLEQIAEQ